MRLNPVEDCMKEWHQPEVVEQDVGMEVTSYLPAELDKTWTRPTATVALRRRLRPPFVFC